MAKSHFFFNFFDKMFVYSEFLCNFAPVNKKKREKR